MAIFLFYSFFLVMLGRQLSFLPALNFTEAKEEKSTDQIRKEVMAFLESQAGQYSVYYEDLVTGERFGIDENTVLTAASLNKIYIVGNLYNRANKGTIELSDTIVIQPGDIQDYGTGSLRYEEPGNPYTLSYLAKLAMKESDNTAAHVLDIYLDEAKIQNYVNALGLTATSMVNNTTSAADVGAFFKLMYQGKVTSSAFTKEMFGYMTQTDFEDRIPRNLPKSVIVQHKTGDGVGYIHDGGIIEDGDTKYVLVVLSSNVSDEDKTKQTIGSISKLVYTAKTGKE